MADRYCCICAVFHCCSILFWVFQRRKKSSKVSDKNNLFLDLPNRYVKNGKDIFVVPDVPPLNTKDFINYLIKDIEVLIEQKKAPLLFGIICISSVCPYKCSYCYNISEHSDKQILSSEKIFRTIEELIPLGVKNIYMSGEDPK